MQTDTCHNEFLVVRAVRFRRSSFVARRSSSAAARRRSPLARRSCLAEMFVGLWMAICIGIQNSKEKQKQCKAKRTTTNESKAKQAKQSKEEYFQNLKIYPFQTKIKFIFKYITK